jgi:acyl dehydratase
VDPVAATESNFGGLVASGMHTLALLVRAQHDVLLSRTAAAAGIGLDELRFRAPLRPDRVVRGTVEVLAIGPRDDARGWGRVVFGMCLCEEAGRKVLTVENQVLVWCRAADTT